MARTPVNPFATTQVKVMRRHVMKRTWTCTPPFPGGLLKCRKKQNRQSRR